MGETLVKSKERVKGFGEVYTPAKIVSEMLDCVDEAYEKSDNEKITISTTFLEPACGDGNFIVQILARKLEMARKESAGDADKYNELIAESVMSIYGVDIQCDNVTETRERMMKLIETGKDHKKVAGVWKEVENQYLRGTEPYEKLTGHKLIGNPKRVFKSIIKKNILHGNFLTGKSCEEVDEAGNAVDMYFLHYEKQEDGRFKVLGFTRDDIKDDKPASLSYDDTTDGKALPWNELNEVENKPKTQEGDF